MSLRPTSKPREVAPLVTAPALAGLAAEEHVREELHLDALEAGALADRAAAVSGRRRLGGDGYAYQYGHSKPGRPGIEYT